MYCETSHLLGLWLRKPAKKKQILGDFPQNGSYCLFGVQIFPWEQDLHAERSVTGSACNLLSLASSCIHTRVALNSKFVSLRLGDLTPTVSI